ncbi:class I SAM-dependent methyltransferase [Candidatus Woesearchaeota archaeon]|nr:class I SAM-dependent methyltransferase [Candidatus Woesearchaeota archaeon]
MNVGKAYDKIIDEYAMIYGKNPEYKYFLDQFTATVKKGKILDLGCGTGDPVAKELVKRGYDVIGVDCSRKMIEAANDNVKKGVFILGDMADLELEEESYDGICALFSFIHLRKKELEKLMKKLQKSLKPGGAILIGVREGNLDGKTKMLGEGMYMHEFTEDELRILLSGLTITLFDKREFHPSGEAKEEHIFAMATKPDYHEEANEIEEIIKKEQLTHHSQEDDAMFENLLKQVVSDGRGEKEPLFSFYEKADSQQDKNAGQAEDIDEFVKEIEEPKKAKQKPKTAVQEKEGFKDLLDQLIAEAENEPVEPEEEDDEEEEMKKKARSPLDDENHPLNRILGEEKPKKKSKKEKEKEKKKDSKKSYGLIRIRFGSSKGR